MRHPRLVILLLVAAIALLGARCPGPPRIVGAGFRWSPYGLAPEPDPGPAYWTGVAEQMADSLPRSVPRGIWVACEVDFGGSGCFLDSEGTAVDPLIVFSGNPADPTEAALAEFDAAGVKVWLQVEPGYASVEELIDLLLGRYGHHPSVIGFGVDVEWYRSASEPAFGEPVDDTLAASWAARVRSHDPRFQLFLKHWLVGHMPPSERAGIVFVDDSQGFASLAEMAAEFQTWGLAFTPAEVAFQVGYDADRAWWSTYPDPPARIGARLWNQVPNMRGLYWVDFTALDVFP